MKRWKAKRECKREGHTLLHWPIETYFCWASGYVCSRCGLMPDSRDVMEGRLKVVSKRRHPDAERWASYDREFASSDGSTKQ